MKSLIQDQNNVFFRCVEDSPETIMLTDDKGNLVYVNPAWQKIYGYTWDEAVGQSPRLLRSGHQAENFYKEMWGQILNPEYGYWKGELVNRSKSGEEIPVYLTITPHKRDGVIRGYMGIALDMREKKNMEAKILQQDRLASVGLLASGLAHEIGTPLGIIKGRADLLKSQNKANPHLVDSLTIITTQIERVSGLIRNLLNLSRGQHSAGGKAQVKKVCEEAVSLLSQKLRTHGIDLQNEIPENAVVKIGHNKLEQIVLNLLVNAVYAIESEKRKGRMNGHKISLLSSEAGSKVRIVIKDTGCGIDRQNLMNIFQPFFTTKPIGEGTGLGLSITYQIIQETGGDISVESQVGHGTTFIIELPKA
jgi:two-component system, cell cycle sensor histidine kinase and response regulator CckA